MLSAIVINKNDNVAVVVEKIKRNDKVQLSTQETVVALDEIEKGHKIAIRDIKSGDGIIKYNTIIGEASKDIKKGEWVHTHNVLDTTEKICDEYARQYRAKTKDGSEGRMKTFRGYPRSEGRMKTFKGYPRSDGNVGIRNNVLVLSLIQCANSTANKIAQRCQVPVITIDTGCGEFKEQERRTNLGLIRAGQHPNTFGVLLVSLGCQWTDPEYIAKEISKTGTKVAHLCIQEEGGVEATVEKGIQIVNSLREEGKLMSRVDCPITKLVLSVYCGGSDWSSSLAANVVTGETVDMFGDDGGTFISSSIRGMAGNEQHLIELAKDYEVGNQILDIISEYRRDIFELTGQSIADVNPTPGNKAHGITTLCEKAISNLKLTGSRTPVQGVIAIGEAPSSNGQWLVDNRKGGNDVYACTALAMSGAHICLFTTGLGTPLGNATSVVIKITGNADTFERMGQEMIDYNASGVIRGEQTVQESAAELYKLVKEVADGKQTKAEILGDFSWVTPPTGKI